MHPVDKLRITGADGLLLLLWGGEAASDGQVGSGRDAPTTGRSRYDHADDRSKPIPMHTDRSLARMGALGSPISTTHNVPARAARRVVTSTPSACSHVGQTFEASLGDRRTKAAGRLDESRVPKQTGLRSPPSRVTLAADQGASA